MPLDALSIPKADFGMMRDILERKFQSRGSITDVDRRRLAKLIMDAYRDGMVSEDDLTALVRRQDASGRLPQAGRYLKGFPTPH